MTLAVLFVAAVTQAPEAPAEPLVLRGARLATITRGEIPAGTLLVRDGRIAAIGRNLDLPPDARVLDWPGEFVVAPGFIDLHSHLASVFEIDELTESVTPHVRAVEAFSSTHPDVEAALRSGVTLVALAPGHGNLVAGRAALLRLNGGRLDRMILDDAGPLKLSLGDEALRPDREPTSRTGALRLLRSLLRDPASEVSRTLLREGRIAMIHARKSADILRAVELQEAWSFRAFLVHADEAPKVADRLKNAGVSVAYGPLTVADLEERLGGPARLAKAGVRLAFVSDAPATSEEQLRLTAILAVRAGLDAETALRALTLSPAEMLGLQDRFGSLEEGREADLVVYSGHPLSPASDVEAVIVAGRIVHRKPKK